MSLGRRNQDDTIGLVHLFRDLFRRLRSLGRPSGEGSAKAIA
jgi:hypothetical protein